MIELRNVERSYRAGHTETWVLRRVNLTIHPWEFVTIMGPSGAGKSSLLNVLGMLDDQWKGEFDFDGEPVHAMNRKHRAERQALVADTLDRFQIVGKKDLYPHQLSGGQQQLVGIARAMIHKPALLLADEPTGNLQSKQAKEIMEMFRQLNEQGTTIVQVTHSEANAAFGTRTIELRDGWVHSDTAGTVAGEAEEVQR